MQQDVIFVVACALVDRDGRVMAAQRPVGKDHAGLWEFPGGKIEAGETPEHAIVRELYEELQIEPCETCVQPLTFTTHTSGDRSITLLLYLCRQWDGFVRPTEGQSIKWLYSDRLSELDWVAADIPLVNYIRDNLPKGSRFVR
jgi:8-oxo-dGTP diphosphatase